MWNGCPLFEQFSLELPLWRYLAWYKFEDMLDSSSLFFTRADYLKQKYDDAEGELTTSDSELIDTVLSGMHQMVSGQRTYIRSVSGIPFIGSQAADVDKYRAAVEKLYRYYLNHAHVSCWHQNSGEDLHMWREYVPDGNGVALRTTTRALLASMGKTPDEVLATIVQYIDHAAEPITHALWRGGGLYLVVLQMLTRKKLEFAPEREFRLLTCSLPIRELYGQVLRDDIDFSNRVTAPGRHVAVDLLALQPQIVLHPKASPELHDRVSALLRSHSIAGQVDEWPIVRSSIAAIAV
ncbi:MAG: DUF2971 domain-containing protein [Burkholderiales bacterium]|nr:DUF2971 domain-containing protein [Burkholderiales bacterium]